MHQAPRTAKLSPAWAIQSLTSYVTWSPWSGYDRNQLQVSSITSATINDAGDNGYILALVANALAAYDARTTALKVCQMLDKLRR